MMNDITMQIVDEGIKHGDMRKYLKDLSHKVMVEYYTRRAMGSISWGGLFPPLDIPIQIVDTDVPYGYDPISFGTLDPTPTHKVKNFNIAIKELINTVKKDKIPAGMSPSYHHILGKERKKKW